MESRLAAMREGGARLATVKTTLQQETTVGTSFREIEALAQELIKDAEATPNFALVEGYDWATCVMRNDELCHGIPDRDIVVADGDVISIDVGLLYKGFHLDTSISFAVGDVSSEIQEFLAVGERSLRKAINKATVGQSVYEISAAMQRVVERAGYSAAYQLTGHGIGTELHGEPAIPCVANRRQKREMVQEGQTLAIEIMYAMGDAHVVLDDDGWTYRTQDGSLTAMFEETVIVGKDAPEIVTAVQ